MRITSQRLTSFMNLSGNSLIGLALIGFLLMFFPLFISLPSSVPNVEAAEEFTIFIPTIDARAQIISEVDPFNPVEYKQALKRGVAHAAGTGLPGGGKTVYLFAHSGAPPWELWRTNPAFFKLHQLSQGDVIQIDYRGVNHSYKVQDLLVVELTETEYLTQIDQDRLILQTCTPLGTDWKRLLVVAVPEG